MKKEINKKNCVREREKSCKGQIGKEKKTKQQTINETKATTTTKKKLNDESN